MEQHRHTSSFRDPSGFVFVENGTVYRQINPVYFAQYTALKEAGIYEKFFSRNLLIPHTETTVEAHRIVLQPQQIPFITYPYEWSFSQYKHAALHTLKLQKACVQNGFTLKDATAFNITFHNGAPVFIDTLSIDFYAKDEPWRAYKQFVMHFLAPLVLAKYYGNDMLMTLRQNIDGLPLVKVVKLLPWKARLNPLLYTSIYLTAKYEEKYTGTQNSDAGSGVLAKEKHLKILDALYAYIQGLEVKENTEWENYYGITNYNDEAFTFKKNVIAKWVNSTDAKKIIDHGGNDGTFSRVISSAQHFVLTTDIDANAVNSNYLQVLKQKDTAILPMVNNLLDPSPAIGFNNAERFSFKDRVLNAGFDLSMALALIHHLSLSGNVPFSMSAQFFSELTPYLIIEFPDREDSWVKFLLESKRDFKAHFDYYTLKNFEKDYFAYFTLEDKISIPGTHRTLYLLKRR